MTRTVTRQAGRSRPTTGKPNQTGKPIKPGKTDRTGLIGLIGRTSR